MLKPTIFTLGGAILGGIAGHYLFIYLATNHGLLGYAIPGALVGVGAGFNKRCPARWVAVLCGVIAFFAGHFTIWKIRPAWAAAETYADGIIQLFNRNQMAFWLILVATALAIWIPWRRVRKKA